MDEIQHLIGTSVQLLEFFIPFSLYLSAFGTQHAVILVQKVADSPY